MKPTLRYTLISEGFAEYELIPAYLQWMASRHLPDRQLIRTRIQIPVSKHPSMSKVLQEAGTLCNQSFLDNREPCNFCIVGIDLDKPDHTDEQEKHAQRLEEIKNRMGKVYKLFESKIILYVPIQAIDCWVSYLQQQVPANSLESISKDETKKRVYGTNKPDRQRIESVVREAVKKREFDRLIKSSRSFKHFHLQVEAILNAPTT